MDKWQGGLTKALTDYCREDYYPFHMPGHKRNPRFMKPSSVCGLDITEIDGFDNLHHAQGILKCAQERAARVRGAQRTWFLVNGSTCGLLAAISACCTRGGRILVARNCHKAVYNAIELNGLNPVYVYPKIHERYGIYEAVDPKQLLQLLEKYEDIQAVVLTSPTYEGVVSDIEGIAGIVHRFHIPLIVDSAHGAHLGYSKGFPRTAVALGADVVIESLHKTLPSMTQTALLHLGAEAPAMTDALVARLEKFLAIYQTSSPSYVMMGGMDDCMELLKQQGDELFASYVQQLAYLRSGLNFRHIKLLGFHELCQVSGSDYDPSKAVLYVTARPGLGKWLYDQLLERFHLQLEMACQDYVLAMTSFCDTPVGFQRLLDALQILDQELEALGGDSSEADSFAGEYRGLARLELVESPPMNSYEASLCPTAMLSRQQCAGRLSADTLYIYPPGVPFLVPGERITGEILDLMEDYERAGLSIQGGSDEALESLRVLE